MEIVDVESSSQQVQVGEKLRVTFSITGVRVPFTFPFSNESLTKSVIEFIDDETQ